MINSWRNAMLVLVQALVLASVTAMAWAQDSTEDEGGIIGTGIVGMLEATTLWQINGITIDIAPDTEISSPLGVMTTDEMTTGAVLALAVEPIGDRWAATDVRQIYPVIGPVEQVLDTGVVVMGTIVNLQDVARIDWPEGGAWIAVSGIWKGSAIMATALQQLPEQSQALISGTLVRDAAGVLMVGDTLILDVDPADFSAGDVVEIAGTLTARGLLAESVRRGPFVDRPDVVLSQGFLSQPDEAGFYTLLGSGSTAIAPNPEMINPDEQIMRCDYRGVLVDPVSAIRGVQVAEILTQLGCDFP